MTSLADDTGPSSLVYFVLLHIVILTLTLLLVVGVPFS